MTDHHDSNHNDTNAGEEHPNTTPRAGHDGHDTGSNAGDDLDWAAFAAEHANDLQDVERSRNARRFEKHAQRKEKEALLSVDDLDAGTFTDDKVPLHQRGPATMAVPAGSIPMTSWTSTAMTSCRRTRKSVA